MIILVVGKQKDQLIVHADYLTLRSPFFEVALSAPWKEHQTRVIKLPEDDTATVGLYLDWVYRDRLPTHAQYSADQASAVYLSLAKLYVFGERVLDVAIRNEIVEHVIDFTAGVDQGFPSYQYYPDAAAVEAIYEGTTEEPPMRRLLVDLYARHGEREWLAPEELPAAFFRDVARELVGRVLMGVVAMRGGIMLLSRGGGREGVSQWTWRLGGVLALVWLLVGIGRWVGGVLVSPWRLCCECAAIVRCRH